MTNMTTAPHLGPQDRSPQAIVERSLQAQSRLDVEGMFADMALDVTLVFPAAPDGPREVTGLETIRTFFTTATRPLTPTFALTRIEVHPLADDPERVVAEFDAEGTMVDGTPYQNSYLALVTVRDGTIRRWVEYFDPAPIERALAAMQAMQAARKPS